MRAYDGLAAANREALPCRAPVVVNDFLNLTLYRCAHDPEPFKMDTARYFLMARTAHVPLAIYSVLARQGFGQLTPETIGALLEYAALLPAARTEIDGKVPDEPTRSRLRRLLTDSESYLQRVLQARTADKDHFQAYADAMRPLVQANLRIGAEEQLRQFHQQMNTWRAEHPQERWDDVRVVIMGFHQARDQYVTAQYFRWLLREAAGQDHVVYAEYQFSPFGGRSAEAKGLALELLAKVDVDHRAAATILGDRSALERDVMGPAATEILRGWGRSDWPR